MRLSLQALAVGLILWLAAMAPPAAAETEPPVATASRQIMVMFHLPPVHYRAVPDYSGSYGDQIGHGARRRLAEKIARRYGLVVVSDWPMPLVGVDCFIMEAPPGRSAAEIAQRISQDKTVAWAEPVEVYSAQGRNARNDPLFSVQPATRAWRLADLHEIATGRNVRVAVIDSMVDPNHPDLVGQVQVSENFMTSAAAGPENHGTGVAGVIAARADNGAGIVGVAPNARLLALRACAEAGSPPQAATATCDSFSLAKALVFAINHKAAVINLSLSGPPAPLLGKLLDAALARGAVVVGAYDENLPGGGFPASHAGVIAVAAELRPGIRSVYLAPGHDVLTTQPGGGWGLVNGSSYAAAHVSGLYALLREERPPARGAVGLVGAQGGGIDACATLMRVRGPCDCACARRSGEPAARQ
jgi:subtilisin family serine protease